MSDGTTFESVAGLDATADEPASLNEFLAQVEQRAWRVARFALGDDDTAMDAVQDAMLRLVQHYRTKPAAEWSPLFWRILHRRIVDLVRRRRVRSVVVGWLGGGRDGNGEELPPWEPPSHDPGPAEHVANQQTLAHLQGAVNALPHRQREAFVLRILEDLDVAATAKTMGCSTGSVKTHLSRALHALARRLEDGT